MSVLRSCYSLKPEVARAPRAGAGYVWVLFSYCLQSAKVSPKLTPLGLAAHPRAGGAREGARRRDAAARTRESGDLLSLLTRTLTPQRLATCNLLHYSGIS